MRATCWSDVPPWQGSEPVLVEVEVVPPTYRPVKVLRSSVGVFIGAYVRVVVIGVVIVVIVGSIGAALLNLGGAEYRPLSGAAVPATATASCASFGGVASVAGTNTAGPYELFTVACADGVTTEVPGS
jgi:hypothetical protein